MTNKNMLKNNNDNHQIPPIFVEPKNYLKKWCKLFLLLQLH